MKRTRTLSLDLRERAMVRIEAGESIRSIGAALSVVPSTVSKWATLLRTTGSLHPRRLGGYRERKISGEDADWLRERVKGEGCTLHGPKAELAERGLSVHHSTVADFLHREGLSYKTTLHPSEQDRPDVTRRRQRWKAHQTKVDPERLVFLDETWAKTNMAALRGWGRRGQRLYAKAPFGHWKTMTFLAGVRCDGIVAPWVLDGPINGLAFRTYVEHCLLPALKPRDIVILDNLGSHTGKAVRNLFRSAGVHLLFLPPYSPDLNPIEQLFGKLKHLLRAAAERTLEDTWAKIGALLKRFSPQECKNYITNAVYVAK